MLTIYPNTEGDFLFFWQRCWAGVYGWSKVVRSAEGDLDKPDMVNGFAGEDGAQAGQWEMTRAESYGQICVPPDNTPCVYWRLGPYGLAFPLARNRPTGISKRGNAGQYTDAGQYVLLHGSGAAAPGKIEAKTAQNSDMTLDADGTGVVRVNGGDAKVAREGDPCKIAGALATWMSQVETALNLLSPGAVAPLSPTFLSAPGITINGGADRFKG